jgi:Big-like domain-containing protein
MGLIKHITRYNVAALALLGLGVAGCGADLTLPRSSAEGLALQVVTGNGQQGTVGEALPAVVVVQVKTTDGEPKSGLKVAFLSAGADTAEHFEPETAVTNGEGEAFTRWVLGTAPGPYSAQARIVAEDDTTIVAVTLAADAFPGAPDTVRSVGPTSQPGRRGQPLDNPLTVIVVDRFGNPVAGAPVTWSVVDGDDGELSEHETVTGADGSSSVTWTLGSRIGVERAEAQVDGATGSPVGFTAVVLF